jgi:hypothetical protein
MTSYVARQTSHDFTWSISVQFTSTHSYSVLCICTIWTSSITFCTCTPLIINIWHSLYEYSAISTEWELDTSAALRTNCLLVPSRLYKRLSVCPYQLGFTQPLTEMSIRSREIMFLRNRVRQARRADYLTAICEPIVYTMWDPQHLTTLGLHGLLRG